MSCNKIKIEILATDILEPFVTEIIEMPSDVVWCNGLKPQYPPAHLPLSDDNKLIIRQGAEYKEVNKSELGGGGGEQVIIYAGKLRIYKQYWTIANTTYGYSYVNINSLIGNQSAIDAINSSSNFGAFVRTQSKLVSIKLAYRSFQIDNTPMLITIGVKRYNDSGSLIYSEVLSAINFVAKNTSQYHTFDINSNVQLEEGDVIVMQAHVDDDEYDLDKNFLLFNLNIILK
jgi:hypothetical protein